MLNRSNTHKDLQRTKTGCAQKKPKSMGDEHGLVRAGHLSQRGVECAIILLFCFLFLQRYTQGSVTIMDTIFSGHEDQCPGWRNGVLCMVYYLVGEVHQSLAQRKNSKVSVDLCIPAPAMVSSIVGVFPYVPDCTLLNDIR